MRYPVAVRTGLQESIAVNPTTTDPFDGDCNVGVVMQKLWMHTKTIASERVFFLRDFEPFEQIILTNEG